MLIDYKVQDAIYYLKSLTRNKDMPDSVCSNYMFIANKNYLMQFNLLIFTSVNKWIIKHDEINNKLMNWLMPENYYNKFSADGDFDLTDTQIEYLSYSYYNYSPFIDISSIERTKTYVDINDFSLIKFKKLPDYAIKYRNTKDYDFIKRNRTYIKYRVK